MPIHQPSGLRHTCLLPPRGGTAAGRAGQPPLSRRNGLPQRTPCMRAGACVRRAHGWVHPWRVAPTAGVTA